MKRGCLITIILIVILYAMLSWLKVLPWTRSPGHTYEFKGMFNDPSFPPITVDATPIVPPKALSALPSDYVQVKLTVGTLTFSTDDPQYQCIQGLVPLLFDEELAYPGVFLAVYNNCGSLVYRGQVGLMTISRPLVGSSGLYVMFTIPHDSVCSTNSSGRRLCLATPPAPVPPTPTPTPTPVPPTPTPTPTLTPPVLSVSPGNFKLPGDPNCSYDSKAGFWNCAAVLANSGQSDLNWSASSNTPGVIFNPSSGTLPSGITMPVTISVPGYSCANPTLTFSGPVNSVSVSVSCPPPIT